MTHIYVKASFDGELYHYTCECGHEVHTTDGSMPVLLTVKHD